MRGGERVGSLDAFVPGDGLDSGGNSLGVTWAMGCFLWCVLQIIKCPQRRGATFFRRANWHKFCQQATLSPSTNHVNRDEIRRARRTRSACSAWSVAGRRAPLRRIGRPFTALPPAPAALEDALSIAVGAAMVLDEGRLGFIARHLAARTTDARRRMRRNVRVS